MGNYDTGTARIKSVFKLAEIPRVSEESLEHYLRWLKPKLICPCILTGIESMGYFSWEERYEFGYGNPKDYEKSKEKWGSYQEEYKLHSLGNAKVEHGRDISVPVARVSDKKQFVIPLSELEAVDKKSKNYRLLHDYSVWHVNWGS
ncbi:calcium-binding protein [Prochlorothrix hollandica]|uniref:calcium-binding protein n=1 Tax=Prochlorothrix hollandica TaxID=1223 RepID=UPI000363E591|nr:calcium-binding protein [Prochlorothrix hollandica]